MVSEINNTPKALRLHLGVFGKTNAGKSTFINLITGQNVSLVSPVAGTTTDPVFKPMELLPLGPVVFIDTAGLDDSSELGNLRVEKSLEQLKNCDGAIYIFSDDNITPDELNHSVKPILDKNIPLLIIENIRNNSISADRNLGNLNVISCDLSQKNSLEIVRGAVIKAFETPTFEPQLTGDMIKKGDLVLLTAPQDIQAPKGRLILPEVQTIRDLLDNNAMVMTVTSDNIQNALDSLKSPPALVITDSQIFPLVNEIIPRAIPLTSFSVLMAKIKGDINLLIEGAKAIDSLVDNDKVLIMESCSHHALKDDIAREKIPKLLQKYTGKNLDIVIQSGQGIPENIREFKLAIHCGGCMLNRKGMLSRQREFLEMNIPLTNFGIAISYMNGMLDRICY